MGKLYTATVSQCWYSSIDSHQQLAGNPKLIIAPVTADRILSDPESTQWLLQKGEGGEEWFTWMPRSMVRVE